VSDPLAFAERLTYSDEVAELGVSEEDSTRLALVSARGLMKGRGLLPHQARQWPGGRPHRYAENGLNLLRRGFRPRTLFLCDDIELSPHTGGFFFV